MHELIESIRSTLDTWGELLQVLLNALSLLLILAGLVSSVIKSLRHRKRFPGDHPLHTRFRMMFGGWLVLALEVQLAADIAGTIISPTNAHLVELGAVALIRTFLNYFLGKELKEDRELAKDR